MPNEIGRLVDRVALEIFDKGYDSNDFDITDCITRIKCKVVSTQVPGAVVPPGVDLCERELVLWIRPKGGNTFPGGFGCTKHGLVGWVEDSPATQATAALMAEQASEMLLAEAPEGKERAA